MVRLWVMGNLVKAALICVLLAGPTGAFAEGAMIENFEFEPQERWRFFTDTVMGGVSSGQVAFVREDGVVHAHMTGRVSTANNGGFIQMRTELPDGAPSGSVGVRLLVRGNAQRYFVHLRTGGTVLPWQFYQAGFEVTREWGEVRLPFDIFRRSGRMLRAVPRPDSLKSVAIVAYGRDHDAEIDVREVGFY